MSFGNVYGKHIVKNFRTQYWIFVMMIDCLTARLLNWTVLHENMSKPQVSCMKETEVIGSLRGIDPVPPEYKTSLSDVRIADW